MCEQRSQALGPLDAGSIKECILRLDNGAEEARLDKIEKLKAAIADKAYYVSVPEVARKVMDHMQQRGSNTPPETNQ
jgi:Anti-sigma-28 factor, FlgM